MERNLALYRRLIECKVEEFSVEAEGSFGEGQRELAPAFKGYRASKSVEAGRVLGQQVLKQHSQIQTPMRVSSFGILYSLFRIFFEEQVAGNMCCTTHMGYKGCKV